MWTNFSFLFPNSAVSHISFLKGPVHKYHVMNNNLLHHWQMKWNAMVMSPVWQVAVMFISQFIISSVLASGWTWHLTVGASDTSPKGTSPWCVDDCQSLINSAKSFINCCWRVSGERSYISWQNKTQCQVYNHFAVKIQSVQWMNWKQCFYDASYLKKKKLFQCESGRYVTTTKECG